MGYHEGTSGEDKPLNDVRGSNRMTPKRLLSKLFGLVVVVLLPLSAGAQESGPEEAGKKDEKASPAPELTQVETTEERREGLDRKLDSSLSEFDALILREQEILEQRREAAGAAGGGGGAGTAEVGGGREGIGEEGSAGDEDGEEGGAAGATAEGGGNSPDEASGEKVPRGEGAPETSEGETGEVSNGRVPPDVGDGKDDDIVARQLREAAMKEEDPELREKLWDEYRAYKFGEKKETEG
jgi:hypothetical protein